MLTTQEPSAVRYVPVRVVGAVQVLRLFRLADGSRCAVAFSSPEALRGLLGPEQHAVRLTERALRGLAEPLGVHQLVLDPRLVAPPARRPASAPLPPRQQLEPQW